MSFISSLFSPFKTAASDVAHYGSDVANFIPGIPAVASHLTETYVNPIFDPHPGPDQGELSPQAMQALQNQAQSDDPAARAELSWNAATQYMGEPGSMKDNDHSWNSTSAWALGQTMTAALDQAKTTGNYSDFDKVDSQLQKFKNPSGGGFAAATDGATGFGGSYYDDNSWIGLAYMQAYNQTGNKKYLNDAESQFDFLQKGMYKGGLKWDNMQEPGTKTPPTWNTCTEGPATELALRLHMATAKDPKDTNDKYYKFAEQLNNNMNQYLREPNGEYKDHVDADDPTGKTAAGRAHSGSQNYSYNQGTPIGANVLFYKITGDKKYLDDAQQTATSSLPGVESKGLKGSPAFNAIYYRNLLQLDSVAPNPQYMNALKGYTDEAWDVGRDPSTGLFGQNGMSHYGNLPGGSQYDLLDQSAMVQMYALQAMPSSDYGQIS